MLFTKYTECKAVMAMADSEYISGVPAVPVRAGQELTKYAGTVKRDELPKYWERDYVNAQLARIADHRHQMLLRYLWMSGVRITEALSLRRQDCNFSAYTMTVRWLKSRKYLTRVVPMHPRLRDILQVYTATMKAEDRVFPMTRQRAWQLVQKYFDGNPHKFRHSFAVNWLRSGGDIVTLHKILGHSKIETTMIYLQIVPVDQGRELLKVDFG